MSVKISHVEERIAHFVQLFPHLAAHIVVFGKDSLIVQGFSGGNEQRPVSIWMPTDAFNILLGNRQYTHGLTTGAVKTVFDQQERYIIVPCFGSGALIIREMSTPVEPKDLRVVCNLRCMTVESMLADHHPQFAAGYLDYKDCTVDFVRLNIRQALDVLPDITPEEFQYAMSCSRFDHYYSYTDDLKVYQAASARLDRINEGRKDPRLALLYRQFFVVPQPVKA